MKEIETNVFLDKFFKKEVVIALFMLVTFAKRFNDLSLLLDNMNPLHISIVAAISICFILLCYFAFRNNKIATIVIAIIMILSSSWVIFTGVFLTSIYAIFIKAFTLLVGGYFMVGGILLLRNVKNLQDATDSN